MINTILTHLKNISEIENDEEFLNTIQDSLEDFAYSSYVAGYNDSKNSQDIENLNFTSYGRREDFF